MPPRLKRSGTLRIENMTSADRASLQTSLANSSNNDDDDDHDHDDLPEIGVVQDAVRVTVTAVKMSSRNKTVIRPKNKSRRVKPAVMMRPDAQSGVEKLERRGDGGGGVIESDNVQPGVDLGTASGIVAGLEGSVELQERKENLAGRTAATLTGTTGTSNEALMTGSLSEIDPDVQFELQPEISDETVFDITPGLPDGHVSKEPMTVSNEAFTGTVDGDDVFGIGQEKRSKIQHNIQQGIQHGSNINTPSDIVPRVGLTASLMREKPMVASDNASTETVNGSLSEKNPETQSSIQHDINLGIVSNVTPDNKMTAGLSGKPITGGVNESLSRVKSNRQSRLKHEDLHTTSNVARGIVPAAGQWLRETLAGTLKPSPSKVNLKRQSGMQSKTSSSNVVDVAPGLVTDLVSGKATRGTVNESSTGANFDVQPGIKHHSGLSTASDKAPSIIPAAGVMPPKTLSRTATGLPSGLAPSMIKDEISTITNLDTVPNTSHQLVTKRTYEKLQTENIHGTLSAIASRPTSSATKIQDREHIFQENAKPLVDEFIHDMIDDRNVEQSREKSLASTVKKEETVLSKDSSVSKDVVGGGAVGGSNSPHNYERRLSGAGGEYTPNTTTTRGEVECLLTRTVASVHKHQTTQLTSPIPILQVRPPRTSSRTKEAMENHSKLAVALCTKEPASPEPETGNNAPVPATKNRVMLDERIAASKANIRKSMANLEMLATKPEGYSQAAYEESLARTHQALESEKLYLGWTLQQWAAAVQAEKDERAEAEEKTLLKTSADARVEAFRRRVEGMSLEAMETAKKAREMDLARMAQMEPEGPSGSSS